MNSASEPGEALAAASATDSDPTPSGPGRSGGDTLERLAAVIEQRRGADPQTSYVAKLFDKGLDAILKKVGEEATETVMAAKDGDPGKVVYEVADLWFHSALVLAHFNLKPADVLAELARREGLSGLQEFASRAVSRPAPAQQRIPVQPAIQPPGQSHPSVPSQQ
jgi:phosphoribosyl-ATP pyrophosphohydrolase